MWRLYVPFLRKRELRRLEALAEKPPDLIVTITADTTKFQEAVAKWASTRGRP